MCLPDRSNDAGSSWAVCVPHGPNPKPIHHPPTGACDLIYHTVDLVFALDCNAPPLFTLLTAYRDNIYARPTVAYNTAKEGPCIRASVRGQRCQSHIHL